MKRRLPPSGPLILACMAVITRAAQAQFSLEGAKASPTPAIHDIRPPLDVFPYPLWMIATAGAVAALLLGLVVAGIVRMARNRPGAAALTPRDRALQRLKAAEASLEKVAPYAFSIQVSDILRRYVAEQYHLRATEQTSQEFLADAARTPHFTHADKLLLAEFLDRCDLIKFAHIDATAQDSRALIDQAASFVKGGAAAAAAV